ncbi:MAG: 3-isopropylmalate dehydratase large subunit [Burkholderiales bacterium]|nr:3-isopropylmalate dehydratase large subunit [Burkholderiales bacterium]
MGMNIAEKILAAHAGADTVKPQDVVEVTPDTIVLIDVNFQIPSMGWEFLRIADPERVLVVFDHYVPAKDIASASAHRLGREFVRKFGIKRFHDVGLRQGISHQVIGEEGYALPGDILVCVDSHTCSAGAFNAVARGLGTAEVTSATCLGKTWFQCGETVRYELEGRIAEFVAPKDVFLHLANVYGAHTLQNMEFHGPVVEHWEIDERRALATMCAEVGVEFALFPCDRKLEHYLHARGRSGFSPVMPDPDARYAAERRIDVSGIEPMIALPHQVMNNCKPAGELNDVKVDQCFIGACCNGTLEDIRIAAQIVKGRKVADGVRFIVTPASQNVHRQAIEAGYVGTLLEAGAIMTSATCGACGGSALGVLAPGERAISAGPRNFKGRMGSPDAEIFLGSSASVAASALTGRITDPRSV